MNTTRDPLPAHDHAALAARSIDPTRRAVVAVTRVVFRVLGPVVPALTGRMALAMFTRPRRHTPPAFEREVIASAEAFAIPFEDAALRAWSWGSGPVVLLAHGWEGRGPQLARFMPALVACGCRVVAFDGPGHGDSPGNRATAADMCRAILAAQAMLGPLHGVLAHSFGATATVLALHRGLQARRVVLVGMPDAVTSVAQRFRAIVGVDAKSYAAFLRYLGHEFGASISECDFALLARGMSIPALFVHDRGDVEVPFNEGERVYTQWPGAEMLATEGLGHRRILKDERVIEAARRFLCA